MQQEAYLARGQGGGGLCPKIVGKMERGSVKYGKIGKVFFSVFVKHLQYCMLLFRLVFTNSTLQYYRILIKLSHIVSVRENSTLIFLVGFRW